jgi:phage I-like protein
MTTAPSLSRATCAALPLPDTGAEVPEWVQLLPAANGEVRTHDGRGPYLVRDPVAIIAASFADPRDKGGLLIDENHALDLAAPKGGPAPARGHITELQARADGIWGRVTWTATGRALLGERAYRGISPVILFDETTGEIAAILRAGLTNYPNLRGLAALNTEENPPMMGKIAKKLGLAEDATEEAIMAAMDKLMDKKPDTAMQAAVAAMASMGTTLGVDGTKPDVVKAAVEALQASKAETATLAAQVAALQTSQKRTAADAWMAAQIAANRGIPADKREGLIALHMSDAAQAEAVAKLYPDLGPTHTSRAAPQSAGAAVTALNAEQAAAADQLGIPHDKFLETLKKEVV